MTTTLTLADLDTSGSWRHLDVSERLLADYRACTGWAGEASPDGVLSVIGRLFTDRKVLPPGGVLVETGLHVHNDLRFGLHRARVDMQRAGERNDRVRVRGRITLAGGRLTVAGVDFLAGLAGQDVTPTHEQSQIYLLIPDQAAAWSYLSNDHNPLHFDADFARACGFQRPRVTGALLLALSCSTLQAAPSSADGPRQIRMRFRRPIPVGTEVTVYTDGSSLQVTHVGQDIGDVQVDGHWGMGEEST